MKTMNLGSDEMPEKKKNSNTRNLKIALGLAAVILVPTIGSTLAGSITVGGAGGVEFGQGVVATTACDDVITVTPTSVLTNSMFFLETVVITGIHASACDGKYFTIKALSGGTPQAIGAAGVTACKFLYATDATATAQTSTGGTCLTQAYASTTFTFKPASAIATSLVDKITLESSSS
jgi:hypothetical protein